MPINNIELKDVLAVDGGLRYILHRYPQASGCESDSRKRFKIREGEKSASASLKMLPDGKWGVTDFGGDGKMKDAIHVAMEEDGVDFVTALKEVAAFYDIGGAKVELPRPDYNSWPAKPDEQDGVTTYVTKELTAAEIKTILTTTAWQALHRDRNDPVKEEAERLSNAKTIFAYYHLKSVEYKRFTNKGITHEFRSNERYPIFIYEEGTENARWGRFYEPKAEKKDRFRYFGEKPKVFIHGLEQARQKYLDKNKGDDKDYDKMTAAEKKEAMKDKRLSEVIICSGGSDALNTAALGYQVVWRNSESEEWTHDQYRDLKYIADVVYNLPDIDLTGITQGHKLALTFLDLRTIWLPERMLEIRDSQGKPINKDLRDFLRFPHENRAGTYKKYDFEQLVETALPYEFWDYEIKLDKDGEAKIKNGRKLMEYKPNNLRIYNFLYRMGFCRLKSDKAKEGFVFAHVENNIVREVEVTEMEDFIHKFLEKRNYKEDLRNAFFRSPQLNASSLAKIRFRDMDFKAYGADHQYFFFNNATWKITNTGVDELPAGATSMYVYEDKVLKLESFVNNKVRTYKAKKEEPMFSTEQMADGNWKVNILRSDCLYMNFIIQTCRMYWKEELEERLEFYEAYDSIDKQEKYIANHLLGTDQIAAMQKYAIDAAAREEYLKAHHCSITGELLTREENALQQAHLANRLYTIGFALHRWKVSSRAWCVWAMDNKISDEGESFGGSGKSLVTQGIEQILRVVTLPSRIDKIEGNPFVFENVTRDVDLTLMDDTHQHLSLSPFFAPISGTWVINRKNMKPISIPFRESGKIWFNTNFGDKEQDPSTQRRKLHTVYSDYYHNNATGNYRETRSPKTDFGINLFEDFDEKQWNLFYNFMAQCVQYYLACETEVRAPGENISKRNLMAIMGDNFKNWADVYFSIESRTLDVDVVRDDAQETFFRTNKMTPQSFLKKLRAWCKLYGYTLNPTDMCNSSDRKRIIKNVDGKAKEVFYIQTDGVADKPTEASAPSSPGDDKDDMPF